MHAPEKQEHRTPYPRSGKSKAGARTCSGRRPSYLSPSLPARGAVDSQPILERLVQELANFPVGHKGAWVEAAIVAFLEPRVSFGRFEVYGHVTYEERLKGLQVFCRTKRMLWRSEQNSVLKQRQQWPKVTTSDTRLPSGRTRTATDETCG